MCWLDGFWYLQLLVRCLSEISLCSSFEKGFSRAVELFETGRLMWQPPPLPSTRWFHHLLRISSNLHLALIWNSEAFRQLILKLVFCVRKTAKIWNRRNGALSCSFIPSVVSLPASFCQHVYSVMGWGHSIERTAFFPGGVLLNIKPMFLHEVSLLGLTPDGLQPCLHSPAETSLIKFDSLLQRKRMVAKWSGNVL